MAQRWFVSAALVAIFTVSFYLQVKAEKNKLLIHALIPQNNSVFSADGVIPAAQIAVEDVNNNTSLLPDYELKMEISDSKCDSSEGTWQLIKSILETDKVNETKIIAFLGGACSLATEPTSALSGRLYKVVQVSYAATSPVLSDRTMYPLFYRTSPAETLYNDARFALMNMYNWCYVATLHQTANIFSLTVQDFHDKFPETLASTCNGTGKMPSLYSFTGDPEIPLKQIKNKKIRIIYGFFYEDKALIVMCYAIKLELTTPNHLWILPSWYSDGWWNNADTFNWTSYSHRCTGSEIKNALVNSILLDVYPYLVNPDAISVSGYTNSSFYNKYYSRLETFRKSNISKIPPGSSVSALYTTLIYDAIWAIAIALNKTEEMIQADDYSLNEFMYSDIVNTQETLSTNISQFFSEKLNETDFVGVSGRVRFDRNGTRLAVTGISQYIINSNGNLTQVLLGVYDREQDNLTINYTRQPYWNLGYPPTDVSTPQSQLLNPIGIYMMDFVIGVGIIVAMVLLVFNIVTIRKPLIANSAPHINTIIIIGCIVMMATCILLGIDSGTPQVTPGDRNNVLADINDSGKERYASICMIRVWLFTIGFTLSFGALFAKTWQVYRIYTNTKLKEQPFKMWNFLIIMAIQLVLDIIILSIWTGLFRFHHEIIDVDDEDKNIIKKYEKCECDNFPYLIGALYVYKGLLVVFGLFLAYESRNVKYFYINDSRFVSIAMYIVVILIGISAPLSLVLADKLFIDPAYLVAVIMIVTACMCCLLFLFIPKFIYMAKGADTMIPKPKKDKFTPVDSLQLGHTEVSPEDIQSAEKQIEDLKKQVKEKEMELKDLQKRRGSDQDSGVLCTDPGDSANGGPDSPISNMPEISTAAINETMLTVVSEVEPMTPDLETPPNQFQPSGDDTLNSATTDSGQDSHHN